MLTIFTVPIYRLWKNSLVEQSLYIIYDALRFSKSSEIFKLYLFFWVHLFFFYQVSFYFHLLVGYADRLEEVLVSIAPSLFIKPVESTLCFHCSIITLLNFLSPWSPLHKKNIPLCYAACSIP